ncbi:hypothetical protein SH661x_003453 [Planctomicrobium sp. SH661]|uniref:hypothetical protein n=1 Tax=Planctomicrobium sp. SH661 TaxID=3448124 RepID=UPI003F5C578D
MTKVLREPDVAETQVIKRKSGLGRLFLGLFIVAAAGLFFLPQIAGMMLQNPETLAWVSGQPAGTVAVGEATFGWQGPVQLKNVTLKTPDGHPIANVNSLTTQRSFWDFLTQKSAPLKLQLDGMHLTVVVPEPEPVEGQLDLSELTNAVQKFSVPRSPYPIELTITNSSIDFQNAARETVDTWSNVSADYKYTTDSKEAQVVRAHVPARENGLGELNLQGEWSRDRNEDQTEVLELTGSGDRVALVAANPWLQKYLGPSHGLTECSGQWQISFQRDNRSGWELAATARMNENAPELQNGQVAFAPGGLPAVNLELQSRFSLPEDSLIVPRLQLAADQAAVQLQGSVKEISSQQILQVQAEVQTPGNALLDLLPAEVREQIQIEGMKFSQITINGSLLPAADGTSQPLTYSLVASWDKAAAYGLLSQKGQMKVSYHDGQVRAENLNVPVNGGRLLTLPTLDLRSDPAVLRFPAGVMLENVSLTEEVCRDWLLYISPTMANATSANGRISLILSEGQIPVGHIEQGELGGTLALRDATVRPGPLALQMIEQVSVLQQMLNRGGVDLTQKAVLAMKQEDVRFKLYQGRVYHDNFGANVGEVRLATSGSVGLDQTLALQLQLAMPEKWVAGDRPVLQALASQPISLGVTGTLDDPRIDGSGLADFGKQIGIKAGVGLLEKLIERRIQKNR